MIKDRIDSTDTARRELLSVNLNEICLKITLSMKLSWRMK